MQGERIAAGDESVPRVNKVKGLDGRPYPGALAGQDLLPVLGTVDRLEYPVRSRVPRIGRYFNRPSDRSEEHTSELQSQSNLVCRLLLEKKKKEKHIENAIDKI